MDLENIRWNAEKVWQRNYRRLKLQEDIEAFERWQQTLDPDYNFEAIRTAILADEDRKEQKRVQS